MILYIEFIDMKIFIFIKN